MSKILIIEDEVAIADLEKDYLELSGFEVAMEHAGDTGLARALAEDFDLIVLDLMLPGIDGFEVCRQIREKKDIPVIMVSAKKDDIDKIRGLGLGADDYMTKPFSPSEVMARVRAVLRRMTKNDKGSNANILRVGNLEINLEEYTLHIGGQRIALTKKEIETMWTLASNPKKVFTRDNLLDSLWGYDYVGDTRTVDSHVKRLRAKLDKAEHEGWDIATVWGVGYKFELTENKE